MEDTGKYLNRLVHNPDVSEESPNGIGAVTEPFYIIWDHKKHLAFKIIFRDYSEYWSAEMVDKCLIPLGHE